MAHRAQVGRRGGHRSGSVQGAGAIAHKASWVVGRRCVGRRGKGNGTQGWWRHKVTR
jgi:hypothetical protein